MTKFKTAKKYKGGRLREKPQAFPVQSSRRRPPKISYPRQKRYQVSYFNDFQGSWEVWKSGLSKMDAEVYAEKLRSRWKHVLVEKEDNPGHNREVVEEKFGVQLLRRAPPTPESIAETKRILRQEIQQASRAVDEGKFDQALNRMAYARDTIELGPAHYTWHYDPYFRKVMKSLQIIRNAERSGDRETAKREIRELAEID